MRNVQEAKLVWALVEAAKPHMDAGERNFVFVTVGAGDTFAAISSLINLIAAKRIPLRPQLTWLCAMWLEGYTFHDAHEHLRRVIGDFAIPNAIQASTAIRRLSAPPKPRPLPAVTGRKPTKRLPAVTGLPCSSM